MPRHPRRNDSTIHRLESFPLVARKLLARSIIENLAIRNFSGEFVQDFDFPPE